MRLNRYIARSGITSRRKAEDIILAGKVAVNGTTTKELGTIIKDTDKVIVNDQVISLPENVYYAFNKPTGYATTKSDPHENHTIFELLPDDNSLFAIGRLDRNTSGLLLITNDGDFAQNIIHPSNKIEKEYYVKTEKRISSKDVDTLLGGVMLDDGPAKATKIIKISPTEISLIIEEGRNRIVRRMIKSIGNGVALLRRDRIGLIRLDVPTGKYRELTQKEVEIYVS